MAELQARQPHGDLAVQGGRDSGPQGRQQPALCHPEQRTLGLWGCFLLFLLLPAQDLDSLQLLVPQNQGEGQCVRVPRCDIVSCAPDLCVLLLRLQSGRGNSQLVREGCGWSPGVSTTGWGAGSGAPGEDPRDQDAGARGSP